MKSKFYQQRDLSTIDFELEYNSELLESDKAELARIELAEKRRDARIEKLRKSGLARNIHVVPRGMRWGIMFEGSTKCKRIVDRKWWAMHFAKALASELHTNIYFHSRRGKIETWVYNPWKGKMVKR